MKDARGGSSDGACWGSDDLFPQPRVPPLPFCLRNDAQNKINATAAAVLSSRVQRPSFHREVGDHDDDVKSLSRVV